MHSFAKVRKALLIVAVLLPLWPSLAWALGGALIKDIFREVAGGPTTI